MTKGTGCLLYIVTRIILLMQVDNIPGVRGVGKKTAVTLLKKFDCIDGIYENVDDVGKYRGLDSCICAPDTNQIGFDTRVSVYVSSFVISKYSGLRC